jgi:hypothetical protein
VRSGTIMAAALALLAALTAPAAAAYAGQQASAPTGNDVSYPQCTGTLPSGQAFGIVDVNAGLANTTNPCLAEEITWAENSTGATRQPRVSLYVNTANPGNNGVTDWPVNNSDPITKNRVKDPYGTCTGKNNPACAWQYGWNLAELDAQTRGVPDPGSYRWWLDVETINSWQSSAQSNRADLEGMVSYFRHIGATAGIYSTVKQWDPLVGTVPSTSPLYRLPDWIPGAKTLSKAEKNCRLAPLTGGGTVMVTQWTTTTLSGNSDFSCPSSSPKAKGK